MKKSESVTKIFPALVKAQSVIGSAQKNKVNPHLKNKYADLASVWDAIAPALESNKLALLQTPNQSDDSKLHLETMIIHESGEWISEVLVMPMPKQDPQGYGSALSYARRYHASSMLGVVQDDDDGQQASKGSASLAADELHQCADMDSLAALFGELYKKYRGDNASIRIITRAKDERKIQLAQESGQGFNPAQVADKTEPEQPAPIDQQAPADPNQF